jgi:hypothetical protein
MYLYSVNARDEDHNIETSLEHLRKILESGYILTRETLGMSGWGFNGKSYISLADYDKRNEMAYEYYNSYYLYANNSVSIMIDPKKVDTKVPKLVEPVEFSLLSHIRFILAAWGILDGLYSDLPDEVQVKGRIKSDTFTGITIPTLMIAHNYDINKVKELYIRIKMLLEKLKYNLEVYDISSLEKLEEDNIEDIIKRSL